MSNRKDGTVELVPPLQVDVKINDIVGNGVSGILYKWVNYSNGWKPRWFVLQDEILSYYKINGPDMIIVTEETGKGSKVIGEKSRRMISRHPLGEVHLEVSSIRQSKSHDKRFSIFTGTKMLHLRAETRDDCDAWMQALQAVKDIFPRVRNSYVMVAITNEVVVSTEKLRQRLMKEGVDSSTIEDSEEIMKKEFTALEKQLLLLKQKQGLLIDMLHQLEVYVLKLRNQYHSTLRN